jgi:hypothetical protein
MRVDWRMETWPRGAQGRIATMALIVMIAASAACGRDALDFSGLPDGGAATTKDAAGTKASTTSNTPSAARSSPPADCTLPRCFVKLVSACTPVGACVFGYRSPSENFECYASGVRALLLLTDPTGNLQARVFTPDGALCYSYEVIRRSSEETVYAFREPGGDPVALIDATPQGIVVNCPGEPSQSLARSCLALAGTAWGSSTPCAPGWCK